MGDVTSLANQALIIFGELLNMCVVQRCHGEKLQFYWPFFFDRCVQFV